MSSIKPRRVALRAVTVMCLVSGLWASSAPAVSASAAGANAAGSATVTAGAVIDQPAATSNGDPPVADTYQVNADGTATSADSGDAGKIDKTPITEAQCKSNPASPRHPRGYFRSRWAHCSFYTMTDLVKVTINGTTQTYGCYKADMVETTTGLGGRQQFRWQLYVDSWRPAPDYQAQKTYCDQVTWNTQFAFNNAVAPQSVFFTANQNAVFDFALNPRNFAAAGDTTSYTFSTALKDQAETTFTNTPPRVIYRCDFTPQQDRSFSPVQACIFPSPVPTLQYSRTLYPGVTANIQRALNTGSSAFLTRIFIDTTAYAANGRAKDRRCAALDDPPQTTPPTSYECDEYPFASSYQGLRQGGGSVKYVPSNENERAGSALGTFYNDDRVLGDDGPNGDEYKVVLIP